jgi:hypothetical protein
MTLLGAINRRHRIRRIGFELVQVPNSGDFKSIAILGTGPSKPQKSGRLLNGIAGVSLFTLSLALSTEMLDDDFMSPLLSESLASC